MRRTLPFLLVVTLVSWAGRTLAAEPGYDPLALSSLSPPETLDFAVDDKEREREIPLRIYFPADRTPAPVVLFSHGLGGSREGNAYMGRHWAGRGYVVVFLQHPGAIPRSGRTSL